MERLGEGLWRWTARHPEWHPGEFGSEVASFALVAGDELLLVDPLLPPDDGSTADTLGALGGDRVSILITIPYHVRSAEELRRRFEDRGATIWGHPAVAKRLSDTEGFREIVPGRSLPGGATAFTIGKPRRYEMPIYLPSHRALAFGDAVVFGDGALRVWTYRRLDENQVARARRHLYPTLEPLLELDVERVLVTHGPPVLRDGRRALADAIAGPPWYHPG